MIDMKRRKRALAITTLASLQRLRLTSDAGSWIRGRLRAALALGVLVLTLSVGAPVANAAIFTVTNTNDSGPGSLRQAVLDANLLPGPDTITFSVIGTITLTSGELTVTDHLTIDGPGAPNLTISGNNASRVLQVGAGVTLDLKDVTVADGGGVGTGAGIFNGGGTLTVTDTMFSGNTAGAVGSGGGAIFSIDGTLTVTNSTFSGNSARFDAGGGIRTRGTATVTNSTFSGNSASAGGAIFTDGAGSLTVTNSTFSGNSADFGGGIFNGGFGTLTLRNTIVANSPSGGNCAGLIVDGGGNLQYPGTDCGVTIPVADPLLLPLANYGGPTETMALPPGSPAVDTAVLISCPPTDQRGVARPQGPGCDIGAFELEVAAPCPPTDDDRDDDGLDDGLEDLFGNLLNNADSDDDGIRDGNDDGDDDGEDDEDEDDGTDPCPEDEDGDGRDDEDEDDEEDDD
jgi:predicted outer membrane repeat protein